MYPAPELPRIHYVITPVQMVSWAGSTLALVSCLPRGWHSCFTSQQGRESPFWPQQKQHCQQDSAREHCLAGSFPALISEEEKDKKWLHLPAPIWPCVYLWCMGNLIQLSTLQKHRGHTRLFWKLQGNIQVFLNEIKGEKKSFCCRTGHMLSGMIQGEYVPPTTCRHPPRKKQLSNNTQNEKEEVPLILKTVTKHWIRQNSWPSESDLKFKKNHTFKNSPC